MERVAGRKNWIDVVRAWGIFTIVYQHLVLGDSVVSHFFKSFHVPIFFVVMGLTFRLRDSFPVFFKKKTMHILVPYFIFSLVSIIIAAIIDRFWPSLSEGVVADFYHNILGALYGNGRTGYMKWYLPLWFLPCCFVTFIIVYLFESTIEKTGTSKTIIRVSFILLTIGINILYCKYFKRFQLPFGAEAAISMSGFVEMGILLNKADDAPYSPRTKGLIGFGLLALSYVISTQNGSISVLHLRFGENILVFYLVAILAILGSVFLSIWFCSIDKLEKLRNMICYCGKHTIAILCLHKYPILVFQLIVPFTKTLFRHSGDSVLKNVLGFVIAIIVISLCLIAEKPINYIFPEALGNKRNTSLNP